MEKLLTVKEAAARLGTTERFPRRLIAERRIRYVKLGGHPRGRSCGVHRRRHG